MHVTYIIINLAPETQTIKKPHQNPLDSFEDLHIHSDRQFEVTHLKHLKFLVVGKTSTPLEIL
jgi:hypothetical protein